MNINIKVFGTSMIFAFLAACGGGGGGDAGGGDTGTNPAIIPDVAGTWNVTEAHNDNCGDGNDVENWVATVTQSGADVTVSYGGVSRSGTLNGSTLTWSGSYPEDGGTTTVTSLTLTFSGNTASGSATWSWTDGTDSCSGTTSISAERTSSSAAPPDAPSGLSALATSSGSIDLLWQDNADNEDAYIIERSEVSSTTNFSVLPALPADSQSFSDSGLTPATTYFYRVAASNSGGQSGYSNVANATTDSAPIEPPLAPSNLNGSATSSSSVNLSWTDESNNESSFNIYQAISSAGSFALSKTVSANITSTTIDGLTPATTYAFKVNAVNSAGSSEDSNIHEITMPEDVFIPNAPLNLTVGDATSSSLTLSWAPDSDNETGFYVYRSSSQNGTYSRIAETPSTSYTNTGLTALTTYWYKVSAYNSAGESGQTAASSGTTTAEPVAVPEPPTNPIVSNITSSSATLSWTDNSSDETGFQVGYCNGLFQVGGNGTLSCLPGVVPGSGFNLVDQVGANVTSYNFTGLTENTEYSRFVRAYNDVGPSANTGATFATAQGLQTVTLQAIASNRVEYSNVDGSYANTAHPNSVPAVGTDWGWTVAGFPAELRYAGFVKFDVSTLNGKTIESATLDLEAREAPELLPCNPQNFNVGTVATAWNPMTLTWNIAVNLLFYDGGWVTDIPYPTSTGQTYSIPVTPSVRSWTDGSIANNGLGLLSSNYNNYPGNTDCWDSYNFYVPALTVTYR